MTGSRSAALFVFLLPRGSLSMVCSIRGCYVTPDRKRPFITEVLFHAISLEKIQIFDGVIFAHQKKATPSDLLTGCGQIFFSQGNTGPLEFLSVIECFSSCFLFVCGHQGQERPVLGSPAEGMCRPHTVVCGCRRPTRRVSHWRAVVARHTRSQTEKKAAVKKRCHPNTPVRACYAH